VCNCAAARRNRMRSAINGERATKNRRSCASAGDEFCYIAEMPMECGLLRCRATRFVGAHMRAVHRRRSIIANAKTSMRRNPHSEKKLQQRAVKGALTASVKRKTRESVPSDSPRPSADGVVEDRARPLFDLFTAAPRVGTRENSHLRFGLRERCEAKSALAIRCPASS